MKRRQRVYIMPTKMGGYLNGLLFLMFLLSVGYSNNLLLIFSLILFGFNLVWVLQTHSELQGLKFDTISVEDGFAEDKARVYLHWKNLSDHPLKLELQMDQKNTEHDLKLSVATKDGALGEVSLPARGKIQWDHLLLSTEVPLGLYRVWIYFPLKASSLAYPKLSRLDFLHDSSERSDQGEEPNHEKGESGFRGLGTYQGEESRRISWKHYARTGELLVREGEDHRAPLLTFSLKDVPQDDRKEQYLSELATKLVNCQKKQLPFVFIGQKTLGPGSDEELLKECLRELAVC